MIKLLTAFICSLLFFASPCYARYSGGSGEPNDPYLIATPNDLNSIGLYPGDWDKHFKMISDIDMSGITGDQFNMIGYYERFESPNNHPFKGTFDGDGHAILNFTYQADNVSCVGLFSYVGGFVEYPPEPVIIKNLGLVNPQISVTGGGVGGLVGRLGSELEFLGGDIVNCYIQGGSISGGGSVGGIAGYSALSEVNKCYVNTTVSGSADRVGGIVGMSIYGNFHNSYAQGSVSSTGSEVGGFIGGTFIDSFEHCYAANSVSGSSTVGGFAGYEEPIGYFKKCFWDTWYNPDLNGIGTGREDPNLIGLDWELWERQTYIDAGWDFVGETANGTLDIWRMCEDMVDYPKLWWQYTQGDFLCPDGVNFLDYSYFAGFWYDSNCAEPNLCYKTDIDNSGAVDYKDLAAFTQNWLEEN